MSDFDLKRAYSIQGPDGARDLYRDWASSYDKDFGAAYGFVMPREVARIFLTESKGDTPILDVGAGTGLVAAHLGGAEIDGLDISPEMLEVARAKGLYRNLIEADLTGPLPLEDNTYGGVISSGTFTHGHVGPGCLSELLRVAKPGALFACTVVPGVFDSMGFGSSLALLNAQGRISPLRFFEFPIYEATDHENAEDRALAMIFRKV